MRQEDDETAMTQVLSAGPNWSKAWKDNRGAVIAVVVLTFETSGGRNLARTARTLGVSLSTLQRWRREVAELREATKGTPGRPPKGDAGDGEPVAEPRKRASGE